VVIELRDLAGKIMKDTECEVVGSDGAKQKLTTDGKGILQVKGVVPGEFEVLPKVKDKDGKADKIYFAYEVRKGDTLESVIADYKSNSLIEHKNRIIPDETVNASNVWQDKKNQQKGCIAWEGLTYLEGKNNRDKRICEGEIIYLACKGFKIVMDEEAV